MVGNKCDYSNERKVEFEEGKLLATQHGMDFVETSAKNGTNIS